MSTLTMYTGNVDIHAGHERRTDRYFEYCTDCGIRIGPRPGRPRRSAGRTIWELVLADGFVAYSSTASDGEAEVDRRMARHPGSEKRKARW